METLFIICSLLSPILWFYLGHYFGFKWGRKHPDKSYIEFFIEFDKTKPKEVGPQCTKDPNTCQVAFCDFSKCLNDNHETE